MKKLFSFVLALSVVASVFAQDLTQYEELMQVKFNNGNARDLNIRLSADAPVQYVLPDDYKDGNIVEREVETYYSGKKTLRMLQQEDGTYVLVDPERCTYTLEGLAKSDYKGRITTNQQLVEHTESFIKNAQPKMDADGDWDFFTLKQVGVLGFDEKDGIDHDTCRYNYIFWLEKNGKWLYSNQTYGASALVDTVPPVELRINYKLERDSTYTLKVMHRTFGGKETLLTKFDFVANESGRIEFPDTVAAKGYIEIERVPNHALDIHYVINMANVYYNEVHGRHSFDGKGAPVYVFVDFNDPLFYGEWTNNAAASAAYPHFIAVGSGSKNSSDLTNFGSFDLLAHEYAHLVVAANGRGGMEASGESGALNEAIADCMSVAADFYINGEKANWQIADGVTHNGIPNMRDLSNPKMSGGGIFNTATLSYPQPDTYGGVNWIDPSNMDYDYGGIHFNNGVFNYWFYLLTEGGSGTNDNKQAYEVEGIGMQKTEKLLMHIILNYLKPRMDYSQMRIASQSAAIELWGDKSNEYKQVQNAWFAVGVADRTPVQNVDEQLFNIYAIDGQLVVEAEAGNIIDVYSVVGQHIVSCQAQEGFTTISMSANNGVVIVKVGNTTQKVVLK